MRFNFTAGQRISSRSVLAALTLGVTILSAGCSSAPVSIRPMTIAVRDGQSHRPVAGAVVRVRSVHFHIPQYPFKKMDGTAQLASEAITDERGSVRLDGYLNQPMQVIVTYPGISPHLVYLEQHPLLKGKESPWMRDHLSGELDPVQSSLQVQIRP